MKTYTVNGFKLMVAGAKVTAVSEGGTEQKLTREVAAKILRKAHKAKLNK